MAYVLKKISEDLFWSCTRGWTTDLNEADMYSYEEHMCLALPDGCEWRIVTDEGLEDV